MTKDKHVKATVVLAALQKESKPLIAKLNRLEVKTKDDYEKAVVVMKDLKMLAKIGTAKMKEILDPLKTIERNVRELFEPFQRTVSDWEVHVKSEMAQFIARSQAAQKTLEANFDSGKIARPETYLRKSEALDVDTGIRNVWKAVPGDVAKTPREYLIPDEAKIKDALKAGKKVAGWSWEQVKQPTI